MLISKIQYSFLVVVMLFIAGCSNQKNVEPTLYLVNVLDDVLYKDAHIKGSIQISLADLADKARLWNKDATIVIYCSNYACTASSYAAQMLKKLGFQNVYAYEGGMAEWYQLNKENPRFALEGNAKESYLQVAMAVPEVHPEGVAVITAEELKDMLEKEHII